MNFLLIVSGLILLILGGNWLLKSAVALSLKLEIPKVVIGLTVVSFATSTPELIVSVNAALNGSSDLALGNVIGSNIANISLLLGITLFFGAIEVQKSFYKTDWVVMMLTSMLLYFFLKNDKIIERYEGLILISLLIVFLFFLLRIQKNNFPEETEVGEILPFYQIIFFLTIGGLGLWGGSELLLKGATSLATIFGVSERIIGVTIVSVGTSIPELAASIIAIIKKEKAISLGNLVGSNIFNILGVLGITAIITPIEVLDQKSLTNDILWMLGIAFLILPMVVLPKKMRLNWIDGIVLIVIYSSFVYWTL